MLPSFLLLANHKVLHLEPWSLLREFYSYRGTRECERRDRKSHLPLQQHVSSEYIGRSSTQKGLALEVSDVVCIKKLNRHLKALSFVLWQSECDVPSKLFSVFVIKTQSCMRQRTCVRFGKYIATMKIILILPIVQKLVSHSVSRWESAKAILEMIDPAQKTVVKTRE